MNQIVESLESRQFCSASLANGTLTVTGTAGNDRIEVYLSKAQIFVRLNDVTDGPFAPSQVQQLHIDALTGNDLVDLYSGVGLGTAGVNIPASIDGAGGRDTLIGSPAADTLLGGNGNDRLYGMDGDDLLAGGAGDDRLQGQSYSDASHHGQNTLGGGDGNDTLIGGFYTDYFEGGRGNDTADYHDRQQNLFLRIGPTTILPPDWPVQNLGYIAKPYPRFDSSPLYGCGGQENDVINDDVETVIAGDGNDVLWGNDHDNVLDGQRGDDQLYGGGGYDVLYGEAGDDRFFLADQRDNMPGGPPPTQFDRAMGGEGRDYAMIDPHDQGHLSKIEKVELLPALTS